MGRLSTPTVSSVPGEYNYFSAGAKVIITAGASGYCKWTCYPDHILSNISVCASCTCTHVSFNRFFFKKSLNLQDEEGQKHRIEGKIAKRAPLYVYTTTVV